MANEVAVLIFETEIPIMMTVSDAVAIPKGTLLALSDPFTVAATNADNDLFGGIAGEEKIANDGKTKIKVYRHGIFKVTSGGSTIGKKQVISGLNTVVDYTTLDDEQGRVFGQALETAANGEFFLMELGSA